MKIIHCSDLHLDSKMKSNLDSKKAKERRNEILITYQNMVKYAVEKGDRKMGKVKTHRASAKRFSVTASGKVKIGHCHHRHNTGMKTAKRKRHLRSGAILSEAMTANIRTLIQK